jgi:uncharacterized protein (TIGR03085 family)
MSSHANGKDVNYAKLERERYCKALIEAGPDAPTMCQGWTTGDLAAHSVIRESRPDAMIGLRIEKLAGHTANVQRQAAAQHSFDELVDMIRNGPPTISLFRPPKINVALNTAEFFVHHEDIRRGTPGWEPRELDPGHEDALWKRCGMAKLILHKAPVGVVLRRSYSPHTPLMTVKKGNPTVTVTGPASELILWILGRKSIARVDLDGDAGAISRLLDSPWSL